jgi:hypothetical protein
MDANSDRRGDLVESDSAARAIRRSDTSDDRATILSGDVVSPLAAEWYSYYRIAIPLTELWPKYAGSKNDGLRIEVFETWLERN